MGVLELDSIAIVQECSKSVLDISDCIDRNEVRSISQPGEGHEKRKCGWSIAVVVHLRVCDGILLGISGAIQPPSQWWIPLEFYTCTPVRKGPSAGMLAFFWVALRVCLVHLQRANTQQT